jgi:hypothetical protein
MFTPAFSKDSKRISEILSPVVFFFYTVGFNKAKEYSSLAHMLNDLFHLT